MRMRRLGLIIALSGSALFACGDDSPSDDKPITVPVPDAGGATGIDAGPVAPAAAARPDAAAAADAGGTLADTGIATSAVRDSGSPTTTVDSGAARADSGAAVVDSGTSGGGDVVPATGDPRSAACLSCEAEQCKAEKWPDNEDPATYFAECTKFGAEKATDGMGMGMLKSELCMSMLKCIRETRCADSRVVPLADGSAPDTEIQNCLCGDVAADACIQLPSISDFKGVCRNQIADAAETTNAATMLERLVNPNFAAGVASYRVLCQQKLCADECYAPCKGQMDGALCAGQASSGLVPKQGTCQNQTCQDFLVPDYKSQFSM